MIQFNSIQIPGQLIQKALKIDAPKISTNIRSFIESNGDVYAIAINTWVSMCYDIMGEYAAESLSQFINNYGLIETIRATGKLANELISSNFSGPITPTPLRELLQSEDNREVLQVLRYLKRFTPFHNDKTKAKTIANFVSVNESCKGEPAVIAFSKGWRSHYRNGHVEWSLHTGPVLEYRPKHPYWLIQLVREKISNILVSEDLSHESLVLDIQFSNGVTADKCKTLGEKLEAYFKVEPCYKDVRFGVSDAYGNLSQKGFDAVKAVCVPKSLDSSRIIAEQVAYFQAFLQAIRKKAEGDLKRSYAGKYITLDDQTNNQEQAFLGSVHGLVATIDLSHASDSISEGLAQSILPAAYYNAIKRYNPPKIRIADKVYPRYIFQTSGNGSTFVLEAIIFKAIADVAKDLVQPFYSYDLFDAYVYGDDITVDTCVYDTLVDLLELLGFSVNTTKSYTDTSDYRESCGAEYYCGLDVSTKYYPRAQIDTKKPEGIEALISLQHRLYRYPHARGYLNNLVQDLFSKQTGKTMTFSEVGTDCADLWGPVSIPVMTVARTGLPERGIPKTPRAELPVFAQRELHFALSVDNSNIEGFRRIPDREPGMIRALEMYRYVEFLQHGPKYDTPLDELLHISSKPRDILEDVYRLPVRWSLTSV